MPDDTQEDQNLSVSVPVGVAATGLLLGVAAAAAYILIGRGDQTSPSTSTQTSKPGKGMLRRAGLMTLVTLIENDASRKVVVAVLKMMARRS